jgi:alpha-D-ribose 1-methylphosphonate 5-triphosphate diphosphatase
MTQYLHHVTVVPGAGQPVIECATVAMDDDGTVASIDPMSGPAAWYLMPAAIDLHLDNLLERRRPRATVEFPLTDIIPTVDAECAAAGIGTVFVAARFENEPRKGVILDDAIKVCALVEDLYPLLACDWFVHARAEVSDRGVVEALERAVSKSTRIRLISMMDHSPARSRFSSTEEHRQFYAADLGVSLDEMDTIMARKADGLERAQAQRRLVAKIALRGEIPLVSHDDRSPEQVDEAADLGATVAEFPLSMEAARRARERGMSIVLGAPNAVRRRSTSPGNILVEDAVRAGLCDVLCSDYLPSSMVRAVFRLADDDVVPLGQGAELVTAGASIAGLEEPIIAVGRPLTASLRRRIDGTDIGVALWRSGRLVYQRSALLDSLRARARFGGVLEPADQDQAQHEHRQHRDQQRQN